MPVKIYAEWMLGGKFYNRFFNTWEDYFRATFNPYCEVKVLKEISGGEIVDRRNIIKNIV